jgi:hypothetical protein
VNSDYLYARINALTTRAVYITLKFARASGAVRRTVFGRRTGTCR